MRFWILLFITLLLTACYPNDPYALQEIAQSQIRQTEQAEIQAERDKQLAQAATRQASEYEIAVIIARIDATETTWGILQAQGAATATADAATATAPAIQATQTMIVANLVAQQTETAANMHWQEVKANVVPSAAFIIMLAACSLFGWMIWKLFVSIIDWQDNKRRIVSTRQGVVVYWDQGPQLLTDFSRSRIGVIYGTDEQLAEEAEPIVTVEPEPEMRDALELVQAAIEHLGENGDYVPGHRQVGWSGYRWQKVIAKLAYVGIVAGSGRRALLGGKRLRDVYYEMTTGQLSL